MSFLEDKPIGPDTPKLELPPLEPTPSSPVAAATAEATTSSNSVTQQEKATPFPQSASVESKSQDLPPVSSAPNSPQPSEATPQATPKPESSCDEGQLELVVNDAKGHPIPNLSVKLFVGKAEVFVGATDAKGRIRDISLKQGSVFEVMVKRDVPKANKQGVMEEYGFAAIGKIQSTDNFACLQSHKTKFEFSTYAHAGPAGQANQHKEEITSKHNQTPKETPVITGNPNKKPELKADRDDKGLPKMLAIDGLSDWFGRNGMNKTVPANADDLAKVTKLIQFAETQATWEYEKSITADAYVKQMIAKTFVTPRSKQKDGYQNSVRMCNKYVKIALWYAGYGPASEPVGRSISPAREMGPALISAGFKDITAKLPDGRWAAPGDVIVYARKGAANADGHIDIRTYDGYISDFLGLYLPISQFNVVGIYRKYFDPLPALRVRAFLMLLSSQEATAVFDTEGYAEAFRMLPGKGAKKFLSFASHPFSDISTSNSAAGAYGMLVKTWRDHLPFLELPADAEKFTPTIQDRIAVIIMEKHRNALGMVRKGQIEMAAKALAETAQWPSLPPGNQSRGLTIPAMMDRYNRFFESLKKGEN
jgi:muramidase (phage lysozyme)